jgi:hypothetical protein
MSSVHGRCRPHNFKELAGRRFGRLVALRYHGRNNSEKSVWWCRCDCGREKAVQGACLLNGRSKSCGCLMRETTARRNRDNATHGMTQTPEWKAWKCMLDRCYNPADKGYRYWGGRGIGVCQEWRESFLAFYAHIGPRPSAAHSLDRIDNGREYEAGNVRWADPVEQSRNRRNVRRFLYEGEWLTFLEISARCGVSQRKLWERLVKLGWTLEEATAAQTRSHRRKKT